jgi:DNA-binding NarL/FixJ family response regulator
MPIMPDSPRRPFPVSPYPDTPHLRILLADDHPLFLDGMRNLLTARGVQVVGTARDGLEALEKARKLRPDVILMDIQMPVCDGLAATRLITAEMPEIKVVILTMSSDNEKLFEAIKSGAFGYLLKTQDTEEFFDQLMDVARGEPPFSPGLAARILKQFSRQPTSLTPEEQAPSEVEFLTPRELEVLTLVAKGLTYKETGLRLGLGERTIKYHMGEIIARLHLENRAQVIEYARRSGLV